MNIKFNDKQLQNFENKLKIEIILGGTFLFIYFQNFRINFKLTKLFSAGKVKIISVQNMGNNSEHKKPFNYKNPRNTSEIKTKLISRRALSKDMMHKNRSCMGPPLTSKYQTRKDNFKQIKLEQFNDPNSSILNVVSPTQEKMGFHITDLLSSKNRNVRSQKRKISENNRMNSTSVAERWSMQGQNPFRNKLNNTMKDNQYMIKNFRLVNLSENDSTNQSRLSKPITAAPMSYNNTRALEIKKITAGINKKERFNSTTTSFRAIKSPKPLPMKNSLLTSNEGGQFTDIQPLSNYFEKMFEESHYMFPKVIFSLSEIIDSKGHKSSE